MSLKLYLISQTVNTGYDTYSDAVVVAENEQAAKRIHPSDSYIWNDRENGWQNKRQQMCSYAEWAWATLTDITCTLVAEAVSPTYTAGQVVCASYHAG